ncbi:MAG: cyclic nucleotide-binding domain-containing protein, partial [Bacteroidetes bacterium]|nr:cyclic nucleotide-binding domain-containing protein [Bacteroidota bacterium]
MVNKTDTGLLRNHIQQFIALNDEEWSLLATHLSEKTIQKNDFFAEDGKTAKLVGFLLEGSLRQFYIKNQEERTTYFYFENHLVSSYFSCITGKPSALNIQALADTRMLVFNYDHLRQLFKISHKWETFARLVAEYLALGLEDRMVGLL